MTKVSFKQQFLLARQDAIVSSVNRLLAEKGFDLMTVDEVASDVGIAKASLYKHFSSKEALAAAAMIRILDKALAFVQTLVDAKVALSPVGCLREVVRWTMQVQLAKEMPSLPAQNSSLRAALTHNTEYLNRLVALSDQLGAWISSAQAQGALNPGLAPEVVLYTLFAKACDPVLGLLKASSQHSEEIIIEMLLSVCFDGLGA
jgi:TetR/AcrR family transcriptional regulator, regulator of autoinduction and epiphytic fitness